MTTAVPANAPLVAELDANKANTIFIGSESQGYAGEIHREEGLNKKDWALAHIFAAGPELLSALEDTLGCLQGWMEIADDEDQRDYDYEGIITIRLGDPVPAGLPRAEIEARVHAAMNVLDR